MYISFVGLGKLGLPLASILAEGGHKILGVDKNEHTLSLLSSGQLPFFERGLEDVYESGKMNMVGFTSSFGEAIENTEAMVILVNTQMGDSGYASDCVEEVVRDSAIHLRISQKPYFLFVLSSTVLPGTICKVLIPLIENISGKIYGKDFGVSYVPDFVKLGSVIHDFKNPEFFLIGANREKDLIYTKRIFEDIHQNKPTFYNLTLEETEIAKISLNAYIVNKITFANFLGLLCQDLDNVNIHNITDVIGIDKRISSYFFRSGTPYGGTCFPRDTSAFIKFADYFGEDASHLVFAENVNQKIHDMLFGKVCRYYNIGILGMSFKLNSDVLTGSPSVILAERLLKIQKKVFSFDRIDSTSINLNKQIYHCATAQECIDKSDVIVIMHYDQFFVGFDYSGKHVVDLWGLLS